MTGDSGDGGMIEATRGLFARTQVAMPADHGFGAGMIHHPTDTDQGTWGSLSQPL